MQDPRPPAVGDVGVVQELRSVLFSEPILGATSVRPKGYMKGVVLTALLGRGEPASAGARGFQVRELAATPGARGESHQSLDTAWILP